MRQAGYQGRHDLLEAAREVFGIKGDKDAT
jgi:hypothetical protein